MALRLAALCIDSNDPHRLSQFWASALQWELDTDSTDVTSIVAPGDPRFRIDFPLVPEAKSDRNRIHLDLSSASLDDQAGLVSRLIGLGARPIDIGQTGEEPHVVLADLEGNEFCILEPGNNFVDKESRFGSITCCGSRNVGYFWSAALEWPLIWDQDDETAIRAPDGTGPFITWGHPVPLKTRKNRFHLDVAPTAGDDQLDEVDRLTSLGATRLDIGQGDVDWVVMADPDGHEFCVLTPR